MDDEPEGDEESGGDEEEGGAEGEVEDAGAACGYEGVALEASEFAVAVGDDAEVEGVVAEDSLDGWDVGAWWGFEPGFVEGGLRGGAREA